MGNKFVVRGRENIKTSCGGYVEENLRRNALILFRL